ncbi:MAG TPA: hypothetical protein VKA91_05485, partial [Nitrososphaeraceae archaeon]|nr:hypothetical protein [Nitrososphaeraceae archaeon]
MNKKTQINKLLSQETNEERFANRVGLAGPFNIQDPNKFKNSQRQSWNSVSEGWQRWWRTFENGAQNISSKLVELANTKPGD